MAGKAINILMIISRPLFDGFNNRLIEPVDLAKIIEQTHFALKDLGKEIFLKVVCECTTIRVLNERKKKEWDIIHFIGHGCNGVLFFEDRHSAPHSVDTQLFIRSLQLTKAKKPKLIIISACECERILNSLSKLGIPSIGVGFKDKIAEDAVILFWDHFYKSLFNGENLRESFEEGIWAVSIDKYVGDDNFKGNKKPYSKRFILKTSIKEQEKTKFYVKDGIYNKNIPYEKIKINVPLPSNDFMGRETELLKIIEYNEINNLTIINGMIGLGKSEILKAVSHFLTEKEKYPDGVFWVDEWEKETKQQQQNLDKLLNTILNAYNKNNEAIKIQISIKMKMVLKLLSEKRILLVLDNFEYLTDNLAIINFFNKLPPKSRILISTLHEIRKLSNNSLSLKKYYLKPLVIYNRSVVFAKLLENSGVELESFEDEEYKLFEKTCEELKGHPLSMTLIASYAHFKTFKEIYKELIKNPSGILKDKNLPQDIDIDKILWKSIDISISSLPKNVLEFFFKLSIFFEPVSLDTIDAVLHENNLETALLELLSKNLLCRDNNSNYHFHAILNLYLKNY